MTVDASNTPHLAALAEQELVDTARFTGRISPDQLKAVFRHQPGGVALVTADDGSRPIAITVTSVISVSAEPPLFIFSASALSSSTPVLLGSKTVVVHLLTDKNVDIAAPRATSCLDRFAGTSRWDRLPTRQQRFHGVDTWIRGEIVNSFEAGTSTMLVIHALETHTPGDGDTGRPLVYHDRTWHAIDEHSAIPDPRSK